MDRLTSALLFEYVDDAVALPAVAVRPVGVLTPVVVVVEGVVLELLFAEATLLVLFVLLLLLVLVLLVLPELFAARFVVEELVFAVGLFTATLALDEDDEVLGVVVGMLLLVVELLFEDGALPPF